MSLARCTSCNTMHVFSLTKKGWRIGDLNCPCKQANFSHVIFHTQVDGISPAGKESTSYIPASLTESGQRELFFKVYHDKHGLWTVNRTTNKFMQYVPDNSRRHQPGEKTGGSRSIGLRSICNPASAPTVSETYAIPAERKETP